MPKFTVTSKLSQIQWDCLQSSETTDDKSRQLENITCTYLLKTTITLKTTSPHLQIKYFIPNLSKQPTILHVLPHRQEHWSPNSRAERLHMWVKYTALVLAIAHTSNLHFEPWRVFSVESPHPTSACGSGTACASCPAAGVLPSEDNGTKQKTKTH